MRERKLNQRRRQGGELQRITGNYSLDMGRLRERKLNQIRMQGGDLQRVTGRERAMEDQLEVKFIENRNGKHGKAASWIF